MCMSFESDTCPASGSPLDHRYMNAVTVMIKFIISGALLDLIVLGCAQRHSTHFTSSCTHWHSSVCAPAVAQTAQEAPGGGWAAVPGLLDDERRSSSAQSPPASMPLECSSCQHRRRACYPHVLLVARPGRHTTFSNELEYSHNFREETECDEDSFSHQLGYFQGAVFRT